MWINFSIKKTTLLCQKEVYLDKVILYKAFKVQNWLTEIFSRKSKSTCFACSRKSWYSSLIVEAICLRTYDWHDPTVVLELQGLWSTVGMQRAAVLWSGWTAQLSTPLQTPLLWGPLSTWKVSFFCLFFVVVLMPLHVKLSEQIRPWDTLACC